MDEDMDDDYNEDRKLLTPKTEAVATASMDTTPREQRKLRSDIWQHFEWEAIDSTTDADGLDARPEALKCAYCGQTMPPTHHKNATRLRQHLTNRCQSIDDGLRRELAHNAGSYEKRTQTSSRGRPKAVVTAKRDDLFVSFDDDFDNEDDNRDDTKDDDSDAECGDPLVANKPRKSQPKFMTETNEGLKLRSDIWQHFKWESMAMTTDADGLDPRPDILKCIYCFETMAPTHHKNATRLRQHLTNRCISIDVGLRRELAQNAGCYEKRPTVESPNKSESTDRRRGRPKPMVTTKRDDLFVSFGNDVDMDDNDDDNRDNAKDDDSDAECGDPLVANKPRKSQPKFMTETNEGLKLRSDIWQHFKWESMAMTTDADGLDPRPNTLKCIYCGETMAPTHHKNATRLRQHLTNRCKSIDDGLRRELAHNAGSYEKRRTIESPKESEPTDRRRGRPKRKVTAKRDDLYVSFGSDVDIDDNEVDNRHTKEDDSDAECVDPLAANKRLKSRLKSMTDMNERLSARLKHCLKQNEALIHINRHQEQSLVLMERMEAVNRSHSIRFDDCDEEVAGIAGELQLSSEGIVEWRRKLRECGPPPPKKLLSVATTKTAKQLGISQQSANQSSNKPESSIWQYFQRVNTDGYNTLKCNYCDKTFRSKNLNAFQVRLHIVEQCDKCPPDVRQSANLWRQKSKVDVWQHYRVRTGASGRFTARCLYCGLQYSHRNATKCRRHLVFKCKRIPQEIRDQLFTKCDEHFLSRYSMSDASELEDVMNAVYEDILGDEDIDDEASGSIDTSVWSHYEIGDDNKPVCMYCGTQYAHRNATKCRRHLITNCESISQDIKRAIVRNIRQKALRYKTKVGGLKGLQTKAKKVISPVNVSQQSPDGSDDDLFDDSFMDELLPKKSLQDVNDMNISNDAIWAHYQVPNYSHVICRYCGQQYMHRSAAKGRQHLVFQCKQIPEEVKQRLRDECSQHFLATYGRSEASELRDHMKELYADTFGKTAKPLPSRVKSRVHIWSHFDTTDPTNIMCLYCNAIYTNRNATKCRRHLVKGCPAIPLETKRAIVSQYFENLCTESKRVKASTVDMFDGKRHKSKIDIWSHYEVPENKDMPVVCRYCDQTYSGRNATKCRRHLVFGCKLIPQQILQDMRDKCDDSFFRNYARTRELMAMIDDDSNGGSDDLIDGDNDDDGPTGGPNRPKSRVWKHFEEQRKPDGEVVRRCRYCDKQFQSGVSRHASKIRYHLAIECQAIPEDVRQTLVGDNKVFACVGHRRFGPKMLIQCCWPGCDKRFPKQSQMKYHMMVHTGERLTCDWPGCEWKGRTKSNLRIHKYTHSGDKPHACDWPGCDFRSLHASSLYIHKLRHNNVLNYVCDWENCGRHFLTGSQLKVHRIVHTRERPYRCQLCDKCYPTSHKLKVHQNKQHPNYNPNNY